MAKITETEIEFDGRVIKVRTIEGDIIESERRDGTREVIRGYPIPPKAEEWPYRPADGPAEWRLYISIDELRQMLRGGLPVAIRLLSENGEQLLKLVGITLGGALSADGQDYLMGTEAPLDS